LSLLRKCLALCLRIRYDSIANSCLESFFPVLAGYPTFLRVITRPASALLPIYTAPLLNLLHTLPVSDEIDLKFLPSSVFSQYASSHPLICSHIIPISDDGIDARVVPYVPQDVTSPVDVVDPIRARRGGTLLNLDRVLLHSPHFAQGWNSLFGELRGDNMSISVKSKELAICVVAVLNEAEYEFFQHQEPWVAAGASEEQVLALRQLGGGCHESFLQARQAKTPLLSWSCFDSMELDIIQLTVEMTKNVKTTPELMARLKETLGGNAALVEITGVIAGYNMVSRFLVAMDITALDEGGI
jgi:alkylhydroperoxidase family enzyme